MLESKSYSEKLKDPRWQAKRLEKMQEQGFQCEVCGDHTSELHIHHRRYIDSLEPWEYSLTMLACLCSKCHKQIHFHRLNKEQLSALVVAESFPDMVFCAECGCPIFDNDCGMFSRRARDYWCESCTKLSIIEHADMEASE